MPNYCENILIVDGSAEEMAKFKEAAFLDDEQFLSAEKLLPISTEKDKHWREACREYWGTKWDLCDFSLDKDKWFDPSTHSCSFLTAWSPPVELFDYIARQFPKLIFKLVYLEGGFHFSGMVVWHGGKRISTRKFDFVEQGIAKDWFGFNDTECEYIGAMTEDELLVLRLAA